VFLAIFDSAVNFTDDALIAGQNHQIRKELEERRGK
jgi:hypothetical protein